MNLRALQQIHLGGKHGLVGRTLASLHVIQVQFPVLTPDLINQHFQNNSNSIW